MKFASWLLRKATTRSELAKNLEDGRTISGGLADRLTGSSIGDAKKENKCIMISFLQIFEGFKIIRSQNKFVKFI